MFPVFVFFMKNYFFRYTVYLVYCTNLMHVFNVSSSTSMIDKLGLEEMDLCIEIAASVSTLSHVHHHATTDFLCDNCMYGAINHEKQELLAG